MSDAQRSLLVRAPDGVYLSGIEAGNPTGKTLIFIHGFCQSRLSWTRQLHGPLAREFRLIAFDLRGHGGSDKPFQPEMYRESRRWADDLATIITQSGAERPMLIAWSYAGRVVNDYLLHHGDGEIAGIQYVAATSAAGAHLFGPGGVHAGLWSTDLELMIASTQRFLKGCFAVPPSSDELETMLAFNMLVPAQVREHMQGRPARYEEVLGKLSVPVLVTHGLEDRVVLPAMSRHTASLVKHAELALYEGVGHAPFIEATERYDHDLADFARHAH